MQRPIDYSHGLVPNQLKCAAYEVPSMSSQLVPSDWIRVVRQFCSCFMTNHFLFQAVVFLVFSILLSVGSIAHPAIVVIVTGE